MVYILLLHSSLEYFTLINHSIQRKKHFCITTAYPIWATSLTKWSLTIVKIGLEVFSITFMVMLYCLSEKEKM